MSPHVKKKKCYEWKIININVKKIRYYFWKTLFWFRKQKKPYIIYLLNTSVLALSSRQTDLCGKSCNNDIGRYISVKLSGLRGKQGEFMKHKDPKHYI